MERQADPSRSQTLLDSDLVDIITQATGEAGFLLQKSGDTVILGAYDSEGYIRWSRASAV